MKTKNNQSIAINSVDVPIRAKPSVYPAPFSVLMEGREKRQLGEFFGIKNFGVNLTHLKPNAQSALMHRHSKQDEFIYVVEGNPVLITDTEETQLSPGMCAGFPAGGSAHRIINRTDKDVYFLEVGDRTPKDEVTYPHDDLKAILGDDGQWKFTRKDGTSY